MRWDTEQRLQGVPLRTLAATGSGCYSDGEGGGPWRRRGAADLLSMKGNCKITCAGRRRCRMNMQEGGDFAHGRRCRSAARWVGEVGWRGLRGEPWWRGGAAKWIGEAEAQRGGEEWWKVTAGKTNTWSKWTLGG
jgi:hypothetical protein